MHTYMHTHTYICMSHWVIPLYLSQLHPPLPSLSPPPVLRHEYLSQDHSFPAKVPLPGRPT